MYTLLKNPEQILIKLVLKTFKFKFGNLVIRSHGNNFLQNKCNIYWCFPLLKLQKLLDNKYSILQSNLLINKPPRCLQVFIFYCTAPESFHFVLWFDFRLLHEINPQVCEYHKLKNSHRTKNYFIWNWNYWIEQIYRFCV